MDNLKNSESYGSFLYSLEDKFPVIKKSQINFFSIEVNVFLAKGSIKFTSMIKLSFKEVINFSKQKIIRYAYEVYEDNELKYFYDPQTHPENQKLASTFPHHKHIPPNIKRNRQPAPGLSFDKPNLPFLIQEIIDDLL